MSVEGLRIIAPADLDPLEAADVYLTDIEPTETFTTAREVIANPSRTIPERLMVVADAIRKIQCDLGVIAYHGSVLKEVFETSPDTITSLPEDQRQQVMELIGRIADDDDTAEPHKGVVMAMATPVMNDPSIEMQRRAFGSGDAHLK